MSELSANELQIQSLLLDRYRLRVDPEMAQYASRNLHKSGKLALIGGEPRSGIPASRSIDAAELAVAVSAVHSS